MSIENKEGPPGIEVPLDETDRKLVYRALDAAAHNRGNATTEGILDPHLLAGRAIVPNHATKTARVFATDDPDPERSMQIRQRQRAAAKAKKAGKGKTETAAMTTPRTCPQYIVGGGKLETRAIIDKPDFTTASVMERRYHSTAAIATRASSQSGSGTLYGYPVLWKTLSQDLGGFREQILPGTFTSSLDDITSDVLLLFNHDANQLLGREANATLSLRPDTTGLLMNATLPDTTLGKDIQLLLARGDLRGMSFAFTVDDGGEYWSDNGGAIIRTVTSARLYDVSIVTNGAYSEAWAAVAKQRMADWRADPIAQIQRMQHTDPYRAQEMMRKHRDELAAWARTH